MPTSPTTDDPFDLGRWVPPPRPDDVFALATADWHVPPAAGGGAWVNIPAVADDALVGLAAAARLAASWGVPLLAAGDQTDAAKMSAHQVARIGLALKPLDDALGTLVYVLGNHDGGHDWIQAAGFRGAANADGRVITVSGVTYSGLSYRPDGGTLAEDLGPLRGRPADVGLYHQAWRELAPRGPFRVADLPGHRVAVVGDVHVCRAWRPETGPRLAVSPGPLAPQSVTEFGCGRAYALCRSPRGDVEAVPVPLPARRYVRLVASPDGPPPAELSSRIRAEVVDDLLLPAALRGTLVVVDWKFPDPPPPGWADDARDAGAVVEVRSGGAAAPSGPVAPVLPAAAEGVEAEARAALGTGQAAALFARVFRAARGDGRAAAAREAAAARAEFLARYKHPTELE